MKLDTALYQLRTFPMTFLKDNLLSLAGASISGVRMNYFGRRDSAPGVNEGFKIAMSSQMVSAIGSHTDTYKALSVHNVRMIPRSEGVDPRAVEPYVLGLGGPDIMVTGQLNACTFAIRQEVGQLVVAHIQPSGGKSNTRHDGAARSAQDLLDQRLTTLKEARQADMTSRVTTTASDISKAKKALSTETGLLKGWMQHTMKVAGQFDGHGRVTHSFGPTDYGYGAYVVGIRNGATWNVYAQRVAAPKGPILGVTQIV